MDDIEKLAKKIAQRFQEVREWREMTRWGAAVRIGISGHRLGRIEAGDSIITLNILFKAAKVYQVEVDVLLCRKDIPGGKGGGKRSRTKISLVPHPA